ncbi:hypothetical protein BIV57_05480 [Mangrovactinospora gilvigrisea]|uniref:Transcriptional regulator n=1 Tax=Mangrovactinospora gilvigrisea TaxID=1428644 RepID=A0A1J7BIT3_9ACTN|nr:hypothetical protein BIV57_05480 [Mangrovactinospora gilvigrisea]
MLAVVVLLGAGGAYAYYRHLNGNLQHNAGDLTLGDTPMHKSKANAAGQTPLNILLIGNDSRAGKENVKLGGSAADAARKPLADVEMLLHVSADRSNASVLSIPRDTRVDIPECKDGKTGQKYPAGSAPINTSLQHGGPGCTVATWYKLTGIPIDHYMMVDFSGVVDMADAVGGVPVCVKSNVHDPDSHLRLTKGTHTIQGVTALEWLRTRHGFEDGSDIGRTHAQHMYLNALLRKMKSDSTMGSPSKLTSLAEQATKKVSVDKGIDSIGRLYSLGTTLKKVDLDRMTMLTMPWAPDPQDPQAHVVPTSDAKQLFAMVRNDVPLDKNGKPKKAGSTSSSGASPAGSGSAAGGGATSGSSSGASASAADTSSIAVSVQNASLTPGRAKSLTQGLVKQGFGKAVNGGNAPTQGSDTSTELVYPTGNTQAKADATAVAGALRIPTSAVKAASDVRQVTLRVGADWPSGDDYSSALPKAGSVPKSASAQSADDSTACMTVNTAGGYTF